MAKYSIHRILSLKKTTAERINEILQSGKFIAIKQGNKNQINGVSISSIEDEIKSNYQKIISLMSNYEKLKSALLSSNAGIIEGTEVARISVAGKEYSLSELIAVSDDIYGNKKHRDAFKPRLLEVLKQAYTQALTKVEKQNLKVENDIKEYLSKATSTDKAMSTDDIKKRSEIFHQDGDYSLIDPLNLKEVIQKLEKEIIQFRHECDATMSEHNALTFVEIDLTDI